MGRPSFQFYPADYRNNAKLRRCSWAARGAWMEVMGLFHDSDEYGLLRWPLKEIAQAIGCPVSLLNELTGKGVLKGSDRGAIEAFTYTPFSGRQAGPTVVLIAAQTGPIWYCSRMVRDEYIRQKKANHGLYKNSPNYAPMPPMGEGIDDASMPPKSDLPSSSSSSSINKNTATSPKPPKFSALDFLLEAGVDRQLAVDWLEVRKTKKLASTKTALQDMLDEVAKTGTSLDSALKLCCTRGWGGFKAKWLQNEPTEIPAWEQ